MVRPQLFATERPSSGVVDLTAPASLAQRALWLLSQTTADAAVYNEPNVYRLQGALDIDALRRAVNEIVRRHESLRTRFRVEGGDPVQVIVSELELPLEVTDLSSLAENAREAEAHRRAREEARSRFDLEQGPLIRVRLLRLAQSEYWLLITRHHVVRDGTSDVLFAQELSVLYAAYCASEPSPLAEPPLQYKDYARWQREQLQGPALEEQLGYWRHALAGLPVLELPADRLRPSVPSHRGARVTLEIGERLTRSLKELGHAEGTTLFTTLLASLQVLLYRYSAQEDVPIGVAVSGRRPDFAWAIGYFTNMLVLRGDLSGNPTFRQHLARVFAQTRSAYLHQDIPFAKLVEELAPVRDPSRNPLFQVSLVKGTEAGEKPELVGLTVETVATGGTETVKFDLDFSVAEDRGKIAVVIEYATDLFAAATIERMAGQWRILLEDIVTHPDQPVSRLALLDEALRRRILVDWNATRASYPAEASIAALFVAQARRTPEAVALLDGERTLSYAGLDQKSRALAQRLCAAGVAPGRRVGVCIERSLEEVVALLGVLKAGCAYVPLDPTHPAGRLAELLAAADAVAVVTTEASLRALSMARATSGRPVLTLAEAEALAVEASADPPLATRGEDPAYVMYTSGSTGIPKGVVIPQRAVLRLVLGTDYVQLGPVDVVAHLSNPAFDAATFEIWGALLNGARLAVIPREAVFSPPTLLAKFDRHRVGTFFMTTALFHQIAREAPRIFGQRQVLFGGEAAEPQWVAAALREGRPRRLLHVYGPTEATSFATWHEVRAVEPDALTVPIGRPIANTEVYILDAQRELVPPGVPGEIWIGGPGLALGYLNDAQHTEERFVPHPFSAEAGTRLYRTGDRARYRDEGVIEFLGRFDSQIKIRGYRIEPAEVEAALLRLPEVRQAVVLARGSSSATRRLSAYVVPAEGAAPTPEDLWLELRRTLPEYLVPQGIVILQSLPLTSNGKIDRQALPDPADLVDRSAASRVPPETLIEHMLAAIWRRLLGVRRVDVRQSFFDLGGHSLLVARMMDEIEHACGVRLPVTTLFSASTIEQLAATIRAGAPAPAPLATLNAAGSRPPLFFLHGDYYEGGLYCRGLAAALGAEQPFYAVHPHGLDGTNVPPSIEAMAADRVTAVRRERPRGPYFLGGHCNGALVAVEIARKLIDAGEEVPVVVVLDGVARAGFVELSAGISPSPQRAHPRDSTAAAPDERERDVVDIMGRFRRAVMKYVPRPFPGRIAVLRSADMRDTRPDLGWQSLAAEVETHPIPGSHLASVTSHVAATSACIKACLDAAYRSAALGRPAGS
jgi:amino acid adenylation domain-containing protein